MSADCWFCGDDECDLYLGSLDESEGAGVIFRATVAHILICVGCVEWVLGHPREIEGEYQGEHFNAVGMGT